MVGMTYLDLTEMTELRRRIFDVDIALGDRRTRTARAYEYIVDKVRRDLEVDTNPGDWSLLRMQEVPAENLNGPRYAGRAVFSPPVLTARFDDGPKAGKVIQLPSPRLAIVFRQVAGQRTLGGDVEYDEYTYLMAGYDTATSEHVFRYADPASGIDEVYEAGRALTKYINAVWQV